MIIVTLLRCQARRNSTSNSTLPGMLIGRTSIDLCCLRHQENQHSVFLLLLTYVILAFQLFKGIAMKAWIQRWGPAILVMAIIFAASATPGSDLPNIGAFDVFFKKGGHMLGYALLAGAYFHALNNGRNITRRQFALALTLAILYAAADEFHQLFTPGRSSSKIDVLIDAIGSSVGLGLWCLIRARFLDPHKATVKQE
jgi:VanZ family protein